MEFARHAEVTSALQVPFYFPKGQDLTDISQERIQEVVDELNIRPRKCLGYRTPYEVFYKKRLHLT